MKTLVERVVKAAYHGVFEPARTLVLKPSRLKALKLPPGAELPTAAVDPFRSPNCPASCDKRIADTEATLRRYIEFEPAQRGAIGRARMTPMAIELGRFPDYAAFEALVRKRSSRTLPKVRRCEKKGYVVHRFPMSRHVHDIHAINTSMPMRAAGPVLDYWLLRPEDIGEQATTPTRLRPFQCRRHWSTWWGVFEPAPGHTQGGVALDERLVAYIRTVRNGHVLHYAEIMGHKDHLGEGVMVQAHLAIVRWLMESGDRAAKGVRVVLYGGAETGREGLLTWKRRAGFEPVRLALEPGAEPPPRRDWAGSGLRRLASTLLRR